jgi:hypothetical protein
MILKPDRATKAFETSGQVLAPKSGARILRRAIRMRRARRSPKQRRVGLRSTHIAIPRPGDRSRVVCP